MIDKETEIFNAVATHLRGKYATIFISSREISSTPSVFPAVSAIQSSNKVNESGSTFNEIENVASEEYKFEVFSNLETGKKAQAKEIASEIDTIMNLKNYIRYFNNSISNGDPTIERRIVRYRSTNVT